MLLSYLAWVADGQTRAELLQGNGYGHPRQIQRIVSSMLSDGTGRELQIATAFFVSNEMRSVLNLIKVMIENMLNFFLNYQIESRIFG
jgi:hypothetical protein